MKILEILENKYVLWAIIILGAVGVFKINSCTKSNYETQLSEYQRVLDGKLSDAERALQTANNALGVASSKLVTQEELNAQLAKDKDALDAKFKEYIKKYELEIASMDSTIAALRQQIQGGNSGTTILGCDALAEQIKTCIISYNWTDPLNRFKLIDPNIFTTNDETFNIEQYFRIEGSIWKQKNGSLETHRIVLQEVTSLGDGKYKDVPGGKAEIVSSEFFYTNAPYEDVTTWRDLFRLRAIVAGDIGLIPTPGKTNLSLGVEFFSFKGLGINSHTMLDFKSLPSSEQHLGLSFRPTLWGSELNLAVGASVGTPFNSLFKKGTLSLDLIFYVND